MQQVLAGCGTLGAGTSFRGRWSLDALLQRREVQVLRFDATYRSKVNPSEAEVEAYYKSHGRDVQVARAGQHRVRGAGPAKAWAKTSSRPRSPNCASSTPTTRRATPHPKSGVPATS
jgi:hypothetical protein